MQDDNPNHHPSRTTRVTNDDWKTQQGVPYPSSQPWTGRFVSQFGYEAPNAPMYRFEFPNSPTILKHAAGHQVVPVPQSLSHARAMLAVAQSYIDAHQNEESQTVKGWPYDAQED